MEGDPGVIHEKIEALGRLVWARLILRRAALTEIRLRWAAEPGMQAPPSASQLQTAVRLGRLIAHIARRLPWELNCLVQSVALTAMLRRRSIPVNVEFGVKQEEPDGRLVAHAWVTCGGLVILDSDAGGGYVPFNRVSG